MPITPFMRGHTRGGKKGATRGWASCPLVENGVTRIMANPRYSTTRRFAVGELVGAIAQFAADTDHAFWPDTLSLRDPKHFDPDRIHGSRALTDIYLLALAASHAGRLVTFDRGIPVSSVKIASSKNLVVL